MLMSKAKLISYQPHGDPVLQKLLIRVLKSSAKASLTGQYYRNSLTSGPSENGHFQSTVGCQKGGLQGQVGHRAGAALRVDPALNGLAFIRVAVCRQKTTTKRLNSKKKVQSSRKTPLRRSPAAITGSFMISRVIGQRYSSGVPLEAGGIFNSSIFFMTLLRRPRDSDRAQEHFNTAQTHPITEKWDVQVQISVHLC